MKKTTLFAILLLLQLVSRSQTPVFQWARQLGGSADDLGRAITVDAFENVYVAGDFLGTGDYDPGPGIDTLSGMACFISKSDNAGNHIWAKKIGGYHANTIAVDAAGNVYAAGMFYSGDFDPGTGVYNMVSHGQQDVFVVKLDASGNFLWARQLGGAQDDIAYSLALDNSANVYVTGNFSTTVDFDPGPAVFNVTSAGGTDIFIWKLDTAGNFAWMKQMGGATGNDYGYAITLDAAGNIYSTGYFSSVTADFDPGPGTYNLTGLTSTYQVFASKLDQSGNFIWAQQLGEGTSNAITVDNSGGAYITGYLNFNGIFAAKVGSSGNIDWTKIIHATYNYLNYGSCVAADANGKIYCGGYFVDTLDFDPGPGTYNMMSTGSTPSGPPDGFIYSMDTTGNFVWATQMTGYSAYFKRITAIATNGNGNVYVTGYSSSFSSMPMDCFIYKLHQTGVGINENNVLKKTISVYPNPANNRLTISSDNKTTVMICNTLGQQLMSFTVKDVSTIDVSSLPSGIYFVKNTESAQSIKFIKQ